MSKILIVDDNAQNLYMLQALLEGDGHEVVTAVNGAEALDTARIDPPDMIISDVLMPVMDGFALCRQWKKDEVLKAIPFVFYTATYTDSKDEEFALVLGAARFVVKPVDPDVFAGMMREVIEEYEAGGLVAPCEPCEHEEEVFKLYNERLVAKLEKKMLALEAANRDLEQEITERKRAEEALKRSEAQLSNALQTARASHWEYDVDRDVFTFNDNFYGIFRTTAAEVGGYEMSSAEYARRFCHPDDAAMVAEETRLALETADPNFSRQFEHRILYADGEVGYISVRFSIVKDSEGRTVKTYGVNQDITERKRTDEALRESEGRFRGLFENMGSAVAVYEAVDDGADFIFRDFNTAAERIDQLPRDRVIGRRLTEVFPGAGDCGLLDVLRRTWKTGAAERVPEALYRDSRIQGWRQNFVYRLPSGEVVAMYDDVTERRSLEAQLLRAQKMEAIGRLAGGVAHDFNNLLTGINGFVGFAREAVEAGSQAYEDLSQALALSDRAANLTRQLLAFSRRQTLEPVVLDLNSLLAERVKMLERILGEDIDIQFVPAADLGNVCVDPGQVEQVIMNLAVNARDAMPNGGKLTIETANVQLGREYARVHAEVEPGPYVMLAVSDTGCGMDEATRAQLFEPFFTTKEAGKGTGLGLSTVYGILKQHGASIWVYSEEGKGTTFKVYLPRVAGPVEERRPKADFISGGAETILLVEDDDAVRDIGRRHLEALGYTVLCTAGAREAEEVTRGHEGHIDLLLTDVVMPDRNGRELYEALAARRPGLKVLYMSGYTDNTIVHHGVLEGDIPFLQKPFERHSLADMVRQALDG